MQGFILLMSVFLSVANAEDNWTWVHIEDAKGNLLLGTVDSQPPSVNPREQTANTPKFQIQLLKNGLSIRDSQGLYLTIAENSTLAFVTKTDNHFQMRRHYDGKVSFTVEDKYLTVDEQGLLRPIKMEKAKSESIFKIVELASKQDSDPTTQPKLDCRPETIQQIRGDFGKVYNNSSLKTKGVHSESGNEYGAFVSHRYRGEEVVEEHRTSYDVGFTLNEHTYFTQEKQVYFQYKIYEEHREGIRTEIRRYYSKGKPCRCLMREGPIDEKTNFSTLSDMQYNCSYVVYN